MIKLIWILFTNFIILVVYQPGKPAQSVPVTPRCVIDEPEHGEGHRHKAHGNVTNGQVDDQ